jgi:hypothetical protein
MENTYRVTVRPFMAGILVTVTDRAGEKLLDRGSHDPDDVPLMLLELLRERGEKFRGTIPGTFEGDGERFYLISEKRSLPPGAAGPGDD